MNEIARTASSADNSPHRKDADPILDSEAHDALAYKEIASERVISVNQVEHPPPDKNKTLETEKAEILKHE